MYVRFHLQNDSTGGLTVRLGESAFLGVTDDFGRRGYNKVILDLETTLLELFEGGSFEPRAFVRVSTQKC